MSNQDKNNLKQIWRDLEKQLKLIVFYQYNNQKSIMITITKVWKITYTIQRNKN